MYEDGRKPNAAEKYGLVYVRGCEVGPQSVCPRV